MKQQPDPNGSINPDDVFLLKPDPIMRLSQCVGMHPRFNSQSIQFHRNAKFGSDVLYGTANMIVSLNTKSMKQKFLFDHKDPVKRITMTSEFIISVAKPYNAKKEKKKKRFNKLVNDEEIQVIVWDVHSGANLLSFKPPLIEICDLYVSFKNEYLVLIGKDFQGRDLVLVYNFPDMVKYSKVDLVARQLSDFTIYSVANNPINDAIFVTGGKENIRFWKIKNGIATVASVVHNKLGRGKDFNNVLFDFEYYGDENVHPNKGKKNSSVGKIHWVYLSTA